MAETLYISRGNDGIDITLKEWLDYVKKDETLNVNKVTEIINPETGEIINIPAKEGEVIFKYGELEAYYLYNNYSIELSSNLLNNTLTKDKTFGIAEALNARVETIDGREYVSNASFISINGVIFFILLLIFLLILLFKNK